MKSDKYDWSKFSEMILNCNEETLRYLVRHMNISSKVTDDFLTKLDLIETHEKLFENKGLLKKFSKDELELLRVLMTNKKPRLFGSKSP